MFVRKFLFVIATQEFFILFYLINILLSNRHAWSFDVATVFFIESLGVSLLARRIGLFVLFIREQLIIQEKSWNLIIFLFFFIIH